MEKDPGLDGYEVKELSKADLYTAFERFLRSVVVRFIRDFQLAVEVDELLGEAALGLFEAQQRYDPVQYRHITFVTFAYRRIRGTMIDACRRERWFLGKNSTLAAKLSCVNEYMSFVEEEERSSQAYTLSDAIDGITQVVDDVSNILLLFEMNFDSMLQEEPVQETQVISSDRWQYVLEALEKIPDAEREILMSCYIGMKTMSEVADELGYSKSWVSRTHGRAITRLRTLLRTEGVTE